MHCHQIILRTHLPAFKMAGASGAERGDFLRARRHIAFAKFGFGAGDNGFIVFALMPFSAFADFDQRFKTAGKCFFLGGGGKCAVSSGRKLRL